MGPPARPLFTGSPENPRGKEPGNQTLSSKTHGDSDVTHRDVSFRAGYLLHLDFIIVDLKDGSTLVIGLFGSSALKADIIMLHFFFLSEIISLTNRIALI